MRFFFLIIIITNSLLLLGQQNTTVSLVTIEGLNKTSYQFCESFLACTSKTGNIPKETIEEDVQRLWNLGLFANVDYKYVETENGNELVFTVKEKFYWLPIFAADFSDENFRFTLGALNYNLDGRGTYIKAAWHYYDRSSFELIVANPHLFSRKWGMQLELNRWATLEPTQTYENSGYTRGNNFNVTKWNTGTLAFYSPEFRQTLFFGGNFLNERYQEILKPTDIAEDAIDFTTNKALAKVGVQLNNIDYYYHYRSGWQAMSTFETVYTFKPSAWFWKWVNDFRYYKRINEKHNFLLRGILGVSTNEPMPFPAFVHDDFVNLRGVGNRVGRGIGEFTVNTEWHSTVLFKKNLGAIAIAAFSDFSTLMPIGGKLNDLFGKELTHLNVGGGVRLHAFKFYHGVLRIDYGVDLLNTKLNGFVIGLGHFF